MGIYFFLTQTTTLYLAPELQGHRSLRPIPLKSGWN